VLNAITRNNTASPKRYGGGKAIPVHTHFNSLLHLPVEKFQFKYFKRYNLTGQTLNLFLINY
jgi:hypothetical protein